MAAIRARIGWRAYAVAVLVLLVLCTILLGLKFLLLTITAVIVAVYLRYEQLLAKLVCWAIGRIPQEYQWTIDRIKVRPSFSEKDGRYSEVVLVNWTWHNPKGFNDDSVVPGTAYLLQIDSMLFRMKLSSIWGAIKHHKSIEISLLRVQGLRFNTHRNKSGALNLWQALDLPDDDVNVKSFASQAWKYGGLHEEQDGGAATDGDSSPAVVPLPPISTAATRAAAGFWKPEWGPRPDPEASVASDAPFGTVGTHSSAGSPGWRSDLEQPLLSEKKYVEEPIGDPRRRPRWGVPVRFDIQRLHLVFVQLWVLDLMTLDVHTTSQRMDRDKTRIEVHSLNISRQRLEHGDDRRAGSVDDVHGVYLGELIWVLVAEVIPLVVKRAPFSLSRNVALAAGLAIKDATKRATAKTVQVMHHLGHSIKEAFHHQNSPHSPTGHSAVVKLHLISGKQVTRKGYSVNPHAFIELVSSTGTPIAEARSEPVMWTKVPKWDEHFDLGPATSSNDVLRVTLYHQKSRQAVGFTLHTKEAPDRFIGEVVLPLKSLLIRDQVIEEGGEVVGWFTLADPRGMRNGIPCTGQLKLGVRVLGVEHLADNTGHHDGAEHSRSDWAILK